MAKGAMACIFGLMAKEAKETVEREIVDKKEAAVGLA
jgi:hypothetical protein